MVTHDFLFFYTIIGFLCVWLSLLNSPMKYDWIQAVVVVLFWPVWVFAVFAYYAIVLVAYLFKKGKDNASK